jgi:hypothetical protein
MSIYGQQTDWSSSKSGKVGYIEPNLPSPAESFLFLRAPRLTKKTANLIKKEILSEPKINSAMVICVISHVGAASSRDSGFNVTSFRG